MSFWEFLYLMLWGFFFICYLMVLFHVVADLFRDKSIKGWEKALWAVALLFVPLIAILVYLIFRGQGMDERDQQAAAEAKESADEYIRSVVTPTDPASQIAQAKSLFDAGTITAEEFAQLKAKALA